MKINTIKTKINSKKIKYISAIASTILLLNLSKVQAAVETTQASTFDTPLIKVLVLTMGIALVVLVLFGASQQDSQIPLRKIKFNKDEKENLNTNSNSNSTQNPKGENQNNQLNNQQINKIENIEDVKANNDVNNNQNQDKDKDQDQEKSTNINDINSSVIKEDGINFEAGITPNSIEFAEIEEALKQEEIEAKKEEEAKKEKEKPKAKTKKATTKKKKDEKEAEEKELETEVKDDLTNEFLKNMDKMLNKDN